MASANRYQWVADGVVSLLCELNIKLMSMHRRAQASEGKLERITRKFDELRELALFYANAAARSDFRCHQLEQRAERAEMLRQQTAEKLEQVRSWWLNASKRDREVDGIEEDKTTCHAMPHIEAGYWGFPKMPSGWVGPCGTSCGPSDTWYAASCYGSETCA